MSEEGKSGNSDVITIPEKLEDVDHTWLSSLLGFEISPVDFIKTPNAQAGTGFLSQILRVQCIRVGNDNKGEDEKLNLIVKLIPQGSSAQAEFAKTIIVEESFDVKENDFYSVVLPDLLTILPELETYMCPFYKGLITENPRNSVLILEDLKPQGYHTINFAKYLPVSQIEETVRFLAKFHYAGSALEVQKTKPLNEVYPILKDVAEHDPEKSQFFQFFREGHDKLGEFFKTQNASQEFIDYFNQLYPKQIPIFRAVFKAMHKNRTLIHGDLWSNNLLVVDDDKSIKVIDWQLLGYADPAFDLAVTIVSVLPMELLNREVVDKLLSIYFDTYAGLCKVHGLENLLELRSNEEFSKTFYTLAMGYVFAWFTFSPYPFSTNFPRLIKIYEFLKNEADVVPFLLTLA